MAYCIEQTILQRVFRFIVGCFLGILHMFSALEAHLEKVALSLTELSNAGPASPRTGVVGGMASNSLMIAAPWRPSLCGWSKGALAPLAPRP